MRPLAEGGEPPEAGGSPQEPGPQDLGSRGKSPRIGGLPELVTASSPPSAPGTETGALDSLSAGRPYSTTNNRVLTPDIQNRV